MIISISMAFPGAENTLLKAFLGWLELFLRKQQLSKLYKEHFAWEFKASFT